MADPPLTRVYQAWVAYSYSNYFTAKAGDQQINLDNQRFIGDVGWRQNMQTFDAASVGSQPLKDLNLYYAYVWDVHRVFGNVEGLPAANTDFNSHSHLINISYSGWNYGQFTAYSYLLDKYDDEVRCKLKAKISRVRDLRSELEDCPATNAALSA